MRVRPARPEEAGELSALALRSKGYWGYDAAFLAACREELTLRAADVLPRRTAVAADGDGRLLGFRTLEGLPTVATLGMLFVAPEAIGRGVGGLLFRDTVASARALGFRLLRIDADPHAEGFYRAMGAVRTGSVPSGSVPGRELPLMELVLGR